MQQHTADADGATCRDMRSYAVLCSISTFCALGTTVLLLAAPAATWRRITDGELHARVREIAAGVGATARRSARTAIHTRGRSLFGPAAAHGAARDDLQERRGADRAGECGNRRRAAAWVEEQGIKAGVGWELAERWVGTRLGVELPACGACM